MNIRFMIAASSLVLTAVPALAQITYISQNRSVASRHGPTLNSPDFAPFNATSSAPFPYCESATQTSTLGPSGITGSITASASRRTMSGCSADSESAGSTLIVTFDVVQPGTMSVTLGGSIQDTALVYVYFYAGTPQIPEGRIFQGLSEFNVAPGRYTFRVEVSAFAPSNSSVLESLTFSATFAQPPFTIDWSTIDGGGALNLVGGPFTVSGTVSQCDATARAAVAGGAFSLTGGFWAVGLPRCDADINNDGVVNSQDFFDFLSAFFNQAPVADYNRSGIINSQDFFDFLAAFFTGC